MKNKRLNIAVGIDRAYNNLIALCAKREICSAMAEERLRKYGLKDDDIEKVIQKLKEQKFIDDNRFLSLFVRYKLEFDGWGPKKIEQKLLLYNFSKEQIESEFENNKTMIEKKREELIEKKRAELKRGEEKNIMAERAKIEKKYDAIYKEIEAYSVKLENLKKTDHKQYGLLFKKYISCRKKANLLKYTLANVEKNVALSMEKKLHSFLIGRGF